MSDLPVVGALYRHFKGSFYVVSDIASDCETLETIVVYREVDGDGVWTRPLHAVKDDGKPYGWSDPVEINVGVSPSMIHRFERVN